MPAIPTLLMLPPTGASPAERWVGAGRLAAAGDLIERLHQAGGFDPVMVLCGDLAVTPELEKLDIQLLPPAPEPFHFGRILSGIIEQRGLRKLAYFGGASAPLLTATHLRQQCERLARAGKPTAIVNNIFSSDWFMINDAGLIPAIRERLPADNPIGYVLTHEVGIDVLGMEPEAATRLDLDTPVDYALLAGHPALGKHLQAFLASLDPALLRRVEAIKQVLQKPASTLAIIGRCGSQVWQALERATQIWVRVFVEERGMVASRRLEQGLVRSLVGEMVEQLGPQTFLERVGSMADGLLWDTRVWMGMGRPWPPAADRFASDLGQVESVQDPQLRELTLAARQADFPVLLGGYGVVAGGIYALLESLGSPASPAR